MCLQLYTTHVHIYIYIYNMWIRPLGPSAGTRNAQNHEFSRVGGTLRKAVAAGPFWKVSQIAEKTRAGAPLAATRFRVRALPGAQHTVKYAVSAFPGAQHTVKYEVSAFPGAHRNVKYEVWVFPGAHSINKRFRRSWERSDHEFSRLGALRP